MAHRPRKEMIAETRAKLVDAARQAFGTSATRTRRWTTSPPRPA